MSIRGTPKIRAFLATKADIAVVLVRTGHRRTVVFRVDYGGRRARIEKGAVFHGRFYPSRCDLSPDGRKFLYFVMRGRRPQDGRGHSCWTAISSPPSLTAEFLLPHDDTWGGGGRFLSNRAALIANGMHDKPEDYEPLQGKECGGIRLFFDRVSGDAWRSHVASRVIDRGWRQGPAANIASAPPPDEAMAAAGPAGETASRTVGGVRLTRSRHEDFVRRGDFSAERYRLADKHGRPLVDDATMDEVTWADFDRRGRLWLARGDAIDVFVRPGHAEKPPDERFAFGPLAAATDGASDEAD